MRHSATSVICFAMLGSLLAAEKPERTAGAVSEAATSASEIKFRKVQIDPVFRSEGVTVADVDQDGDLDVLAGEVWYAAPSWKVHEISKPGKYNGARGYSNCFATFAEDLNGDRYPDYIHISFPGTPASWFENPKGKGGHWKQQPIWHSACNESPQYSDLLGNGKRQLVMGWQPPGKNNEGIMSYFVPSGSGNWKEHRVSSANAPGTFRYAHGLGVGDVNGDGRNDVIIVEGWWEAPAKRNAAPWKFHSVKGGFGPTASDMHAYDVNGDGLNDIISSSAHKYGIRWFEQARTASGSTEWKRHVIDDSYSQTHALHLVDMDGDGVQDLVTGKRYFAHQGNDPGGKDPVVMYWYKLIRGKNKPEFDRQFIAEGVGVGTQFEVRDMNGDNRPDVIVSNKKGVHVVFQR